MHARALVCSIVFAALVAVSCHPVPQADGGGDVPVGTSDATDVATADHGDAAPDAPTAALFAPCTASAMCPGPRAACLSSTSDSYPDGLCSRHCSADTDCGSNGACLPFGSFMLCFEGCLHGSDCRAGYNCFSTTARPDLHACFPACTADAQCPGTGCNRYTGFCEAVNTSRADDGAGCTASTDCRSGRCHTETDTMALPTGYLDGECFSDCTVPDLAMYASDTLPQGNCPGTNVCVPFTGSGTGDLGQCLPNCTDASQCRAGFICVRNKLQGTGMYTNGYCAPMNCHYMTQMCPAGATCQTTVTSDAGVATNGICTRASDGGTGGDASADGA